jgi:hypothetical protein
MILIKRIVITVNRVNISINIKSEIDKVVEYEK